MIRRVFDPSLYSSSFLLLLLLLLINTLSYPWIHFIHLTRFRILFLFFFFNRDKIHSNVKFLTSNESKDTDYCSSISVEWFPPRNFQDYIKWVLEEQNQVRWDWYLADFSCTIHVFECSCFFSSISMSLYMIHCTDHFIRCNFIYLNILLINWLLRERKRKIYHVSYHLY